SEATESRAAVSLGKQEPPHPKPAPKNRGPIRESRPMPRVTSVMSAPTRSHKPAISLAKLIFVAKKALAAYLIISALVGSVATNGGMWRTFGAGTQLGGVNDCSKIGRYNSSMARRAALLSVPTTMRSG